MRDSPDGTSEPDRHRQKTLDLAAYRELATYPVLAGGPSAPGANKKEGSCTPSLGATTPPPTHHVPTHPY